MQGGLRGFAWERAIRQGHAVEGVSVLVVAAFICIWCARKIIIVEFQMDLWVQVLSLNLCCLVALRFWASTGKRVFFLVRNQRYAAEPVSAAAELSGWLLHLLVREGRMVGKWLEGRCCLAGHVGCGFLGIALPCWI